MLFVLCFGVSMTFASNHSFLFHVPPLSFSLLHSRPPPPPQNATSVSERFVNYGGLFVGNISAEVFGDYGVGPNHTLPTAGTARHSGGLSVFHFLRVRTFLELDEAAHASADTQALVADSAALARLEGLEAHARSAERRLAAVAVASKAEAEAGGSSEPAHKVE